MLKRPLPPFLLSMALLLAGISSFLFYEKTEEDRDVARRITVNLERELARIRQLGDQIRTGGDTSAIWSIADASFFLFEGGRVAAWSTNAFTPELDWVAEPGTVKFVGSLRGDFVTRSWGMGERGLLVGVIPLIEKYRITNRYLGSTVNERILPAGRTLTLSSGPNTRLRQGYGGQAGTPVRYQDRILFSVLTSVDDAHHGTFSFVFIAAAIVFFVYSVLLAAWSLHDQRRFAAACATLIFAPAVMRIGMIWFGFPAAWSSSPVFDSTGFASSSFNPSIGDLLFNSLYVAVPCLYLFISYHRWPFFRRLIGSSTNLRVFIATVSLFFAFLGFLFPYLYYETVFHNSSVTLDWTQSLHFDIVRMLAFISVLIGSFCSFLFCHVLISLATKVAGAWWSFLIALAVAAAAFVLYYVLSGHSYLITLLTGSGYVVILFLTGWHKGLMRTSYLTFLYFIFAVLCFALQGSFSVRKFTEERMAELQHRFGLNFLIQRDVLGEYLLNEASTRISLDPFIQSSLGNPLLGKGSIRQKILQVHLNSYFARYDAQVNLYSATGEPLDNATKSDFASFITQFGNDDSKTTYKGIYFVNQVDETSARRYVVVVPVSRQERTIAYVTLTLALKKIVPQSVYPELLVDNRFAENFRPDQYSYAIFHGKSLISTFGSFNYERDFDERLITAATETPTDAVVGSYRHTLISGDHGRVAVVTTTTYPAFYMASNFAFWTLVGVLVITLGVVLRNALSTTGSFQLNYATRIQLYIFLAFIIPLVAVSVTTLEWTSTSAEERLHDEYTDKARKLSEQIAPAVARYVRDSSDVRELEDILIETTRLAGVDASIYSSDGKLVATNQPQIFDNLILSGLIHPGALLEIRKQSKFFIREEHVGKLSYNSSYAALLAPESGEPLGILSIPFFESGYSLEKSRITILSNVLIVFILIFLLFTFLSFVATRWLTSPLRMITKSLRGTTLKGQNTLLNWRSNDEIGWMVDEYNRMVMNLEKSKRDLARSQKESAWREMAQQVAHEIKNPLTPMKLTLQQLEHLVHNGDLSKEKAQAALRSMLTQLEILSEVSASFSSFARMPAPLLEKVEVGLLVEKVSALYADHPSGKAVYRRPSTPVFVMGDDQLLTRIVSNLILNGLQSGGEDQRVTVSVSIEVQNGNCRILFSDDGPGIDEALRDKVFIPHFTTKKSGSGLGLAISKQGIEQSGGEIWFERRKGGGTTFVVSLPVEV